MTSAFETELSTHPAEEPLRVEGVRVRLERTGKSAIRLRFEILGPSEAVVLPPPVPPLRADRLWETTCFEMFLKGAVHPGYRELNVSPSGRWSLYEFCAYRAGMVQSAVPAAPRLRLALEARRILADIEVSLDLPDEPYRIGLCAVIEEKEHRRSFWALDHPAPKPDFHHRGCFAADLPPPPAE